MAAGQEISLNLPDEAYLIRADHLRITQVITNLLTNASKYSPKGAAISIETCVIEQVLNISVIDTGPGIPADQLERVWDTGIRLANSGTSKVAGSGLGLAIARKIVEMHGGTASMESEVGFGTTVTVTLPGATLKDDAADAEVEPERKRRQPKAKRENGQAARRRPRS